MDKLPRLRDDQLNLVNESLEKLKSVNAESSREGEFLRSLKTQFAKGKSLTPRQREWLLSIVSCPEPDRELVTRIRTILSSFGPNDKCGVLEALLVKATMGRITTPADREVVSSCERALALGETLPVDMFTESMRKNLDMAVKITRSQHRLSNSRRYSPAATSTSDSILEQYLRKGYVSNKQYRLVLSVLSNSLSGLVDSPFVPGVMISIPPGTSYTRVSDSRQTGTEGPFDETTSEFVICLVTGPPDFTPITGKFVPVIFEDGTSCLVELSHYLTVID